MNEDSSIQATPGSDVFVSYASQDVAVANSIVEALETHGIKCWIAPRDVRPGTVYADAIVGAINEAKALVLVLSANAMPSAHVGREVERAASKRKQVIAFRVDATPLSRALEYFLSDSQWIDVPKLGMPGALTTLTAAVRQGPATSFQSAPVARSAGLSKRNVIIVAAVAGACLAVGGGVYFWSRNHSNAQTAAVVPSTGPLAKSEPGVSISDKSIAVLPFADMSEKHDQEYFGDGMAEEILDLLAKVPGLHVPARTSSFYFKGKQVTIAEIAKALGVAQILEGSVRKSGNHVRVTVQLVRADNGYHLWSETYDRTLDDLFKVQDEIAGEVVKALKVSMGTNAASRTVPTNSAEAHRLQLQAQFWYYRGSPDDYRRAASYYQQAIDIDPDFAEAWTGLSGALLWDGLMTGQDWHHVRGLVLHAAERAVALDPRLAAAHCTLGEARYWLDWDWDAANTEFEMARSLDSDNSRALHGTGLLAAAHGHLTGSLQLLDQSTAWDPLNYFAYEDISSAYYAMGRFAEAVAAMRKSVELAPTGAGNHAFLAQMLLSAGQSDEALAEVEKESDPDLRAFALTWIYIKLGRRSDADAALADLDKTSSTRLPYLIATLHALRGDRDQAFSWLNRAYQQHDWEIMGYPSITLEPDMRNLHGDPRWAAFLRKMNLP